MIIDSNNKIITSKTQKNLFGYDYYFTLFKLLYEKKKLPNTILLSGQKGLGKSTFAYHFSNFLLSKNEDYNYSIKDFSINLNNVSYNLVQNNIHPNFFLIDNIDSEQNIKIEQVRNLLKFLNKSTFNNNLKIVLFDNIELLNLNSSNALLKALEEPKENTFFFIIHNSSKKIINTIKSRSVIFNIYFSLTNKLKIFDKIVLDYDLNLNNVDTNRFLHLDTPGNLLNYLIILKGSNLNISTDYLDCALFLIDLYQKQKVADLLLLVSFFVENFYNELSLKNQFNTSQYNFNRNKILHLIDDMNKFNLDKKNILFIISSILKNEAR